MIFWDRASLSTHRILRLFQLGSLTLMVCGVGSSQSLVAPAQIADAQEAFEAAAIAKPLRCEITAVRPALDFSLRFQTGYLIDVPFNQFRGFGHELTVFVRVTSEGGDPRFLVRTGKLPEVPDTKLQAEIAGKFVVGEGVYRIEVLLEDDLHRVCRNNWRIQVKRSGSERDLKPTTPPATVEEIGTFTPTMAERNAGGRIEQLSIMIHAAPLSPRLSVLQDDDVLRLVGSLSSLLQQLPAMTVRLTVFNLDQSVVLFRKDDFSAKDIDAVATAANHLQLGLVNYKTLQQRGSPVGFLNKLVQAELAGTKPSDALILLGPRTMLPGGFLEPEPERPSSTAPQLFYIQYRLPKPLGPSRGPGSNSRGSRRAPQSQDIFPTFDDGRGVTSTTLEPQDAIERLIVDLKGISIPVRTPHEFADAIRHMASRIHTSSNSETLVESLPALPPPGADRSTNPKQSTGTQPDPAEGTVNERPTNDAREVEDPTDLLIRLRDQVLDHARRIPNYTCAESIRRDRYEPLAGRTVKSCDTLLGERKQNSSSPPLRMETTDRLRLDVALAHDREIYSWAGANKFEEAEIDEWLPEGAIGTGPFASLLLSIFESRGPRFVFDGDETIDGRRLMEYSFHIAREQSLYRVKARRDWIITGYSGKLMVDPLTAELVHLTVRTEELPEATSTCEVDSTLEYGMVPLGGIGYLLPKTTRQRFIGRDGAEDENSIVFSSCREYQSESTLAFAEPKIDGEGVRAAEAATEFPAGLMVAVELTTMIDCANAAAGDRIEGRLITGIHGPHQEVLAPEGAKVEGRLMRAETRHLQPGEFTIALRWETLDVNGVKMPLSLRPDRRSRTAKSTVQRGLLTRTEIELPLSSETRYGVYRFPAEKTSITSGFRTDWVTALP
jgi:hypothetical protein